MSVYTTDLSARNRAPAAADRLPDHSSLMLAARTIERRYSVSAGMARIVAELVGASIEARQ
jgi:hypothetical protein